MKAFGARPSFFAILYLVLKKKIGLRLVATGTWLVVVSLVRWRWQWDLVELWLGGAIGTFFLEIDHVLYLFAYPDEPVSFRAREYFRQNKLKEVFFLLFNTAGERVRLTFHSAFFQVIFWVTCLFVLTSTGSLFGAGLVLAAGLRLLVWELACLLSGREEELRSKLFWHFREKPTLNQQKAFVYIMLMMWVGMSLFLI